ncbi:putative ankyrin repeat-containing protein [Amylocarpus encephaloides]|uniref:Ankyrin repeat-containing protein n=1 Tax=Amylocarpus encephaloides TaxID=45428 RepID=A0A9P7YHW5_9HELO|nr:putative ankyrin repeat-containing protein [Amylocarpus encephaloides]
MADPREKGKDQEEDIEGATPAEQLVEACRRGNTDLLQEIISNVGDEEKAAVLLNETKTVLGNYLYHEAALRGNYEVIDMLLDQDGFECDPISKREGDTPLHSAIRYINSLPHPLSSHNSEFASSLLSMMLEAGSDARIRNQGGLTPAQLCDPSDTESKRLLTDAIDVGMGAGDYIVDDTDLADIVDDGDAGSGSDSDFDPEEYRREKKRRGAGKVVNGAPF